MLMKYFTEKNTNISVAVNPNNVLYVKETKYATELFFIDSSYIAVTDSYLDTVCRLSEQ